MKSNTQRILLALYSIDPTRQLMLSHCQLKLVVPGLTDGGYRSLLLYLEKKHWLHREHVGRKSFLSIADAGQRVLVAKFPALDPMWQEWKGEWQTIVFLDAPQGDPQFRYLRQQLQFENSLPLSRGVYLKANRFSEKLMQTIFTLYEQSVVIFSVGEMQVGEIRPIVTSYYDLSSLVSVYSSISGMTNQLLIKNKQQNALSDKQKEQISSIIDRLINCLTEDPGFINYYYPGIAGVKQLLPQIQQIIML